MTGKLFGVIRSIYSDVKLCVKDMNSVSDLFEYNIGLLQGESFLTILFSLLVKDIKLFCFNRRIPMNALHYDNLFITLCRRLGPYFRYHYRLTTVTTCNRI